MKLLRQSRALTLLGLLSALLVIMSLTPLGYLRIGPLAATLNMIPVGIAAVALGPAGGGIAGAVFGLTSFVQALTGGSALNAVLLGINPVLTFVNCFVPRLAMGLCVGWLHRWLNRVWKQDIACFAAGFFAAFLNTVFFMTGLIVLFGGTEYMQDLIGGRNVLLFVCGFVGVNAVFEMACSTVIVGALGKALGKARLLGR